MLTISRKACLAFTLFLAASALSAGHRGVSVTIDDGRNPSRCEDLSITFDGDRGERAQEAVRIPETPGQTLRVRVPDHSGLRVVGSDRSDVEILACKAALSAADLPRISVVQRGGEVSVDGPAGDAWVAYLLISAPRGAALDLDAESAPIGLRGLSGRITARTLNGPISLRDCPGEIDARRRTARSTFPGAAETCACGPPTARSASPSPARNGPARASTRAPRTARSTWSSPRGTARGRWSSRSDTLPSAAAARRAIRRAAPGTTATGASGSSSGRVRRSSGCRRRTARCRCGRGRVRGRRAGSPTTRTTSSRRQRAGYFCRASSRNATSAARPR